ncbi:hypothetical protein [Streptomyces sp. NPDC052701]|uniref:hypothetical protein n=1 Tax=Streptomyces sp. NPDC052701 TaxID=3155533 RepID=UPI00342BDBD1
MSADEVHGENPAAPARVRTGPRHAAPRKPLFTRFHMPAGKAIALAAMPTAVLMGMGFTPTLAVADSNNSSKPSSNNLTAEEYKECVAALEEDGEDGASASPTPSPSASGSASGGQDGAAEPSPSASAGGTDEGAAGPSGPKGSGGTGSSKEPGGPSSSSDSGSDDKGDRAEPAPAPSASKPAPDGGGPAATPSPAPSGSSGNLLEGIGDVITGVLTGGAGSTTSPVPTPSASVPPSAPATSGSAEQDTPGPAKGTAEKATDAAEEPSGAPSGAAGDTAGKAEPAAEETEPAAGETAPATEEPAAEATASPSPSASPTADPEDCPAATDAEGGVDNKILLPDDPWFLEASSLTLRGADYQGIVEVRTASGSVKKVLKYVISGGTDIDDLHQLVKDRQSGKTHHVQAAKGSTSTITDGDTVMYTERISGNLLGLIPVTFDPEHPPPLNIPLIYFTDVTVQQAGQFGGTLTVPGLRQYTTG